MKKLSILVLLVTSINCFAVTNPSKILQNNSVNAEEYYTIGYYDKNSHQIVMTIAMSDQLSQTFSNLSQDMIKLPATLNTIQIEDNNPEKMDCFSYFCAYGTTSEGNSFNEAIELYKIEKDGNIHYCMKKSHGKTTHTCEGCPSCEFTKDPQSGEITGCKCNVQGTCNHTVTNESGGGAGLLGWLTLIVSIIALL
ncbi:MAG: hypothetical protein WCO13_05170 [Bacteroidota bacterium]